MPKTKESKREPGVNEITRIAHQAGEQIAQMQQQKPRQPATTPLMQQQQAQDFVCNHTGADGFFAGFGHDRKKEA